MHKLVNVLRVTELAPGEAVERELLLIKVARRAGPPRRADRRSRRRSRARVVDLGADAVVFELVGTPEELDVVPGARAGRTGSRSSSAPGRVGARPRASQAGAASASPQHVLSHSTSEGTATLWQRSTAKATSTSSTARSRSSATAARATPTRSTSRDSGVEVEVGLREGSPSRARPPRRPASRSRTVADAVRGAQLVSILLPDQVQPRVYASDVAPNLEPGRGAPLRARLQRPLRADRAGREPRRDHGRAEGPGPRRPPALHRGATARRRSSPSHQDASGKRASTSRSPTAPGSAPAGRGSSRRPSRRRPRPTSSASRPSSAAAPPS